jgi:tRNA(Ile)-lysidine synthetase-like protein
MFLLEVELSTDMDIDLEPGKYVVAVSGGVDSVVLLHLLAGRPDVRLTVAHYDHGIRTDSRDDRLLVQEFARSYGLPFVYHSASLGPDVSEAVARDARYAFLHKVREVTEANAILTAHHQDDLLETAILNLLRGTGRRGLSSLKNTDIIRRPLLRVPKYELLRYAEREGITWHEDSTNADDRYLRNYVRHRILPRFADHDREALLGVINHTARLNAAIEEQLVNYLHVQPAKGLLNREEFILLPHTVAREVMAEWLLRSGSIELSRKMLERLVTAAKVGRSNTRTDVNKNYWLEIGQKQLALKLHER